MEKILAGIVLGIAATVWVMTYAWVRNPHVQALMIFVGIVSAVRVMSTSAHHEAWGANR